MDRGAAMRRRGRLSTRLPDPQLRYCMHDPEQHEPEDEPPQPMKHPHQPTKHPHQPTKQPHQPAWQPKFLCIGTVELIHSLEVEARSEPPMVSVVFAHPL